MVCRLSIDTNVAGKGRVKAIHPARSMRVERVLDARRVAFQFEANLCLDQVRQVEGTQVRLTEHRAPRDMVKRFAEQMRAGAIFPGIVLNQRDEVIDGNTRCDATRRNGRKTIAAYVCDDISMLEARALSIELNQSNGLAMTDDELRRFVLGVVQEGHVLDTRAYARMTGVKASTLSRWVAAAQFRQRADRSGIAPATIACLSETVRAALQAVRLRSVFMAATDLASRAHLPAKELQSIVAAANAAVSEAEALDVIDAARRAHAKSIQAVASGFRSNNRSQSDRSALHAAALLKCDLETLLDVSPDQHLHRLQTFTALQQRMAQLVSEATRRWGFSSSESPPAGWTQTHPVRRSADA